MITKTFGMNGVHPNDYKSYTSRKPVEYIDVPDRVYIPVGQHIGTPAKIVVQVGDIIEEGQLIAEADGFVSANIHASIPGTVVGIESRYQTNGRKCDVIVIELNGRFSKTGSAVQLADWKSMSKKDILTKIQQAGIVGMGGAGFPTHVKLTIPKEKTIDTLIINGVECEPFITADHRLMLERSEDILEGIGILNKVVDAKNVCIGIEANKKDAIKRLKTLCHNRYPYKIVPLKVHYPQGDEKQLIKAITGRILPTDKLPLDVGVVVENVATTVAIKEAVANDKPLIDRIITVSGSGVTHQRNLKVKIGTLVKDIIDGCGGLRDGVKKVVVGGPMMGFSQMNLDAPVTKGTNCILAFTDDEYMDFVNNATCISCGKCVSACAFGLMPTLMNKHIKYKQFDKAKDLGLMFCKECGACSWVCPAHIPLTQIFRMGKDIVKKQGI